MLDSAGSPSLPDSVLPGQGSDTGRGDPGGVASIGGRFLVFLTFASLLC